MSEMQQRWTDLQTSLRAFLDAHEGAPCDCNGKAVGSTRTHFEQGDEYGRSCVVVEAARRLDVEMQASEPPSDR